MKKVQAQSVGEIITSYLKEEHLDTKIYEQRIIMHWNDVVGPAVNRYTVNRYIVDGKLIVYLSSAALRNELLMHKSKLIKALNEIVDREIIKDIIIK
ncbi:MAG: DUF721 domain-containing protein [Muribaculaceae bacterium]|nr:DUF721 domain-containing protein [Muribaculaceae bacterium]